MPMSAPARPACVKGGRVLAVFGLLAALPGMGQADIGIPFRPPVEHFTGQVFDLAWNGHALEGVFIGDRAQEKPLIIFVPGSEPVPLFCAMGNAFQPLFPHQLLAHGSDFNFLLLSKPGIPAVQARERLDENFYFVEDPGGGPPDAYLSHNTLEFCTAAHTALLDRLGEVCRPSSVTLMGHSQGARIVAELTTHPAVSRVVYMSADPLGRMAALYDAEYARFNQRDPDRSRFLRGLLDPARADSLYRGERYTSFRSFAKPSLIGLAQATVPTLLVYGDLDESCPNCYVLSLLPEWYPRMQVLHYAGYDHNYFDQEGKNHWGEVMEDVIRWVRGG